MPTFTYQIVEHEDGWAYRHGNSYSPPFPTREAAIEAARHAASEQREPDQTEGVAFEEAPGDWRTEVSGGDGRGEMRVEG